MIKSIRGTFWWYVGWIVWFISMVLTTLVQGITILMILCLDLLIVLQWEKEKKNTA